MHTLIIVLENKEGLRADKLLVCFQEKQYKRCFHFWAP